MGVINYLLIRFIWRRYVNLNQHDFPHGVSRNPLFSWADHPSLINDAVENGWYQFAFTGNTSTPTRSTALVGDHGVKETEAEIIWEVFQ